MRHETETTVTGRPETQRQREFGRPKAGEGTTRRYHNQSAMVLTEEAVITGTPNGTVQVASLTGETRWSTQQTTSAVSSLASTAERVIVGHRGPEGRVSAFERDSGRVQWEYITAEDVGSPKCTAHHAQPTVVDTLGTPELSYIAARRVEQDEAGRQTVSSSVVYAFTADGSLQWAYDTEWPVSGISQNDGQLVVSYRNCPTKDGSVLLLDAETGVRQGQWSPTPEGGAVGDITTSEEVIAVASHADQYGYLLDHTGAMRWSVNIGGEYTLGPEKVYTHPEYVVIADELVLFVTGQTQREAHAPGRHPAAQTVIAVSLADGTFAWKYQLHGQPLDVSHCHSQIAIATTNPRTNGGMISVLSTDGEALTETHIDGIPTAVDCATDEVAVLAEHHDIQLEQGPTNQAHPDHVTRHMLPLTPDGTPTEHRVTRE